MVYNGHSSNHTPMWKIPSLSVLGLGEPTLTTHTINYEKHNTSNQH